MGTCWSGSIPTSRASGSRSSSASASASWLRRSGTGAGYRRFPGSPAQPAPGPFREDPGVDPQLSPAVVDALRTALTKVGYRTDGVRELLGGAAHAAPRRGEGEPALRATRDAGAQGGLGRLLLGGAEEPDAARRRAPATRVP